MPRLPDGTALIGDSRNDENVAVNGLHAAFIAFHNKLLDTGAATNFKEARRLLTWHWQWIVLNEFLPATLGTATPTALAAATSGCSARLPTRSSRSSSRAPRTASATARCARPTG